MKVLATDGLDPEAVDLLQNAGIEADVRPGIVGAIGTILGDMNINIKRIALSDRNEDGTAMGAVSLSAKPDETELKEAIKRSKAGSKINFTKVLSFR